MLIQRYITGREDAHNVTRPQRSHTQRNPIRGRNGWNALSAWRKALKIHGSNGHCFVPWQLPPWCGFNTERTVLAEHSHFPTSLNFSQSVRVLTSFQHTSSVADWEACRIATQTQCSFETCGGCLWLVVANHITFQCSLLKQPKNCLIYIFSHHT